ncbi:tRNA1(Val) (adenine(37)-N6)-methyltransferase [Pelagovum pacificum]|uniref:tRNA1(Val) (adenine(37)-N6)-methyltransferase n=1 Tax=Pelagovum pacificum TaxID=2588711 RepID=UPI002FCDD712
MDPILLAAAVRALPGQSVLELGCGVGTAILALASRIPGARCDALEIQPFYADLARRNAVENGLALNVAVGDVAQPPVEVRSHSYDQVLMNPPYFESRFGTGSADTGRDVALRGPAPMAAWIETAVRRLSPKGELTLIQRIERLPETLAALDSRMGRVQVLPLAARADRAPHLFILKARKGARTPFELCPPLVMHDGARHLQDGDDYRPEIRAVLREGAELSFPH